MLENRLKIYLGLTEKKRGEGVQEVSTKQFWYKYTKFKDYSTTPRMFMHHTHYLFFGFRD